MSATPLDKVREAFAAWQLVDTTTDKTDPSDMDRKNADYVLEVALLDLFSKGPTPTPTDAEITILRCVNGSESGQCRIGGNVHPGGTVSDESVEITWARINDLVTAGLMRRRHYSGWANDDFYTLTDAGVAFVEAL